MLIGATFDYSNMDPVNFQYFKYPRMTTKKPIFFYKHGELYSIRKKPETMPKVNRIEDTFNRAKAVINYFNNLLFEKEKDRMNTKIKFDPKTAENLSHSFQSKHGKYGEKLIEFLGSGPSKTNLIRAGVI
jgi:hypothetical protein